MRKPKKAGRVRSVDVLLFPEFSSLCLANAVEPLRAANTLARSELYTWRFTGITEGVITSSSGLPVQIPAGLSDGAGLSVGAGGDFLFVMPSYGHREHASPACLRMLRAARRRFELIAGFDTGGWLIAAAGLLEGRRATIHWDELAAFEEAFPEVDVRESRFVIDGDVATCGGATTTLDLLLELIERDHGATLCLEVAALFMHGERDPRLNPAMRLSDDRIVRAAAALMRRNMESPLTIAEVAASLNLTQRALELRFKRAGDVSPVGVYRSIRLSEARRLTELTTLSIAEIATRCGYGDATAMTRAYKAAFGAPPSVSRREL